MAGAAVVVLLTGLGVRLLLAGAWTGPVGDALYAVLVYLGVAFLLPRRSAWAEAFGPARLVFGTSFVASDLALYALGVVAATTADLLVSRARR